MSLEPGQIVLDTCILVHWLRGKDLGVRLREKYELGTRSPRPVVPVVVKGELKAFARRRGWGAKQLATLDSVLGQLVTADISHDAVIEQYARLDDESQKLGRTMGKNDLWIAAVAAVLGVPVLTTDKDFNHLHPHLVRVEWVQTVR